MSFPLPRPLPMDGASPCLSWAGGSVSRPYPLSLLEGLLLDRLCIFLLSSVSYPLLLLACAGSGFVSVGSGSGSWLTGLDPSPFF